MAGFASAAALSLARVKYMSGQYDYLLVLFSILVAIFAAYTALDLAGRISSARGQGRYGWLGAGAIAMGSGIWSMHFVGMLAFKLPIALGYDFFITFLSWLMAVLASALALQIVSRPKLGNRQLILGAVFMGAGICGMHYTGMAAMRMHPAIQYDPLLVGASIAIALVASGAALKIGFALRDATSPRFLLRKFGASIVMGIAIAGMHYTAMAGAEFPIGSVCGAASGLHAGWLATLVGVSAIALLGMITIASVLDRRLETRTAQLIHSLSKANEELLHLSLHDPLTNLPNRALLEDRIGQHLEASRRTGIGFALISVDVDGFKAINDNLGRHIGDELLKQAARAMSNTLRDTDTVARVGGDEFVLIINQVRVKETLQTICAKVLKALSDIGGVGDYRLQISASLGVSVYPDDGEDPHNLLARADVAMYAAKAQGRNGFQFYRKSMDSNRSEEFTIQTELRAAIELGQLEVHYQPKFDTRTGVLTGAEALVRWRHPERGMIPPDRFIYIAEKFGMIVDLEAWVLDHVCGRIAMWLARGQTVPPVSVNLSAVRLRQKNLVERVRECLCRHGLSVEYLVFEITESSAMQDIFQAVETLKRFNDLGIRTALDDFGTGYSSLSYLKRLPVQQLKIDRSFINDLVGDGDQGEIVHAIIKLAHALGLKVVAEGVETQAQRAKLVEFECDELQGYLLGRPVPDEDFVRSFLTAEPRPLVPDGWVHNA